MGFLAVGEGEVPQPSGHGDGPPKSCRCSRGCSRAVEASMRAQVAEVVDDRHLGPAGTPLQLPQAGPRRGTGAGHIALCRCYAETNRFEVLVGLLHATDCPGGMLGPGRVQKNVVGQTSGLDIETSQQKHPRSYESGDQAHRKKGQP